MLKGELKRQNLTYEDLVQRLADIGVTETEVSVRNKISRGTFPAVFLFQCMAAIGVEMLPFRQDYSFNVALSPELREKLKP